MTAPVNLIAAIARTTAFRQALLFVGLFVAVAAVAAVLLIRQTNALLSDQVLRALRAERDELVQIAGARGLDQLASVVAERSRGSAGDLYLLVGPRGTKLAGNLIERPSGLGVDRPGGLFSYARATSPAAPARLAAGMAVGMPGGGALVLARDVEDQRRLIDSIRRTFLWSLAGLALAGIVAGVLASRMLLRRIDAINATGQRIMAGDLAQRIPLAGSGDELDDLARNLNGMLDRIEQLMAGLREVSDNIAHDLKSPLSRLRSRAEAALRDPREGPAWREGLERTIEEADELIRTFNALLLIARLEAGAVSESFAAFDLALAVHDVAELYEPVAEEAGLAIDLVVQARPFVRANRELVSQAVANLIDNALKYGARAGQTEPVAIRIAASGAGIEVSVADRGPGIAQSDRGRALRRFVRLDASRSKPGTGLGLSLVAAVARMHGGEVRLEDNAPGLKAVLVLPARLVVSSAGGAAPAPAGESGERAHAGSG